MDVQTIAEHEVGHWLGLSDQYMSGDSSKIMYGYGSTGSVKRTLASGDLAGINWIYPPGAAGGTLSGTVSGGSGVLSGVTVSVAGYPAATTGSNGTYAISGIVSGSYSVSYSKSGYVSQTLSTTIYSGSTTTLSPRLATGASDDDIPGVAIPASGFSGSLNYSTDRNDIYRVYLNAGQRIAVSMTGPSGTDFDVYLYGPSATSIASASSVARDAGVTYPGSFSHTAATSGYYYLRMYAYRGSGTYTVSYTR